DLGDDLRVVGALLVQVEDRGGAGRAGAGDGEPHPVPDRDVLRPAHPPDVPGLHAVLVDGPTGAVGHPDGAVGGHDEGRRVGAVLLGLLCHETDVGDAADGGGVERAVLLVLLDDGGVHRAVG